MEVAAQYMPEHGPLIYLVVTRQGGIGMYQPRHPYSTVVLPPRDKSK